MVKIYYRNLKDTEIKILDELKIGSWVHMENPSDEEMERFCELLKVDKDILKDALDPYEVSRVEQEEGVNYIFSRFVTTTDEHVTTVPILVVLTDDQILTVCREHVPAIDKIIAGNGPRVFTTQRTKLLVQLFLLIHQDYQHVINSIRKQVRLLTVNLEKITNQDVVQFVNHENVFNDFLTSLEPTGGTLEKLLSGKYLKLYEQDKDLVEDLLLSNNQLVTLCRSNLKFIGNVRGAYSTIMSNNLNRTMKLLTAFTLVLTVPTIIASIFGMNIPLPGQNHPMALVGVLLLISAVSGVLVWYFAKKDYL